MKERMTDYPTYLKALVKSWSKDAEEKRASDPYVYGYSVGVAHGLGIALEKWQAGQDAYPEIK